MSGFLQNIPGPKHTLTPPTYFQGVKTTTPGITPLINISGGFSMTLQDHVRRVDILVIFLNTVNATVLKQPEQAAEEAVTGVKQFSAV